VTAVLVIAGTDSSGGAGLVRDVGTLQDLQVSVRCAVTAVTAQTNTAVVAAHVVPAGIVRAQIAAAFATGAVAAVKVGMLADAATVAAVAEALAAHASVPLVLDPVLVSSSGGALLDAAGRRALRELLLPRAALLTPNIPEAAALLQDEAAGDEGQMLRQAQQLLALGARAVLLKGGHAAGAECADVLVTHATAAARFAAPRLPGSLRGSGCALASAIAAYLARGLALAAACAEAKRYVSALFAARPLA